MPFALATCNADTLFGVSLIGDYLLLHKHKCPFAWPTRFQWALASKLHSKI